MLSISVVLNVFVNEKSWFVCMCVFERERERVCVCLWVCVYALMLYVCVWCVCLCVCLCVCQTSAFNWLYFFQNKMKRILKIHYFLLSNWLLLTLKRFNIIHLHTQLSLKNLYLHHKIVICVTFLMLVANFPRDVK